MSTTRQAADEIAELFIRVLDECGFPPIVLTIKDREELTGIVEKAGRPVHDESDCHVCLSNAEKREPIEDVVARVWAAGERYLNSPSDGYAMPREEK